MRGRHLHIRDDQRSLPKRHNIKSKQDGDVRSAFQRLFVKYPPHAPAQKRDQNIDIENGQLGAQIAPSFRSGSILIEVSAQIERGEFIQLLNHGTIGFRRIIPATRSIFPIFLSLPHAPDGRLAGAI